MAYGLAKVALGAAVLLTAGSAAAQERAVRVSHTAIAAGDLGRAERTLLAERRIHPRSPEVLLNLAAVYARSGRGALAGDLYGRVLAADDVLLDLAGGRTASAHRIARGGLAKLQPVLASR